MHEYIIKCRSCAKALILNISTLEHFNRSDGCLIEEIRKYDNIKILDKFAL